MKRPSGESRRGEILDAVVGVIIDIGFTDMTVGDVAKRAGVSTSLVHYHFDSKAALIIAALRVASDEDKAWRDEIAIGSGSAFERLENVLCGSLPVGSPADVSWVMWIETWGETRRNSDIKSVMSELADHERQIILRLLGDGTSAGEFHCPDHSAAAARMMALRDGLAVEHTLFDPTEPVEQMAARLRTALCVELGLTARL
jgi:AcrR family transcriptional regulator